VQSDRTLSLTLKFRRHQTLYCQSPPRTLLWKTKVELLGNKLNRNCGDKFILSQQTSTSPSKEKNFQKENDTPRKFRSCWRHFFHLIWAQETPAFTIEEKEESECSLTSNPYIVIWCLSFSARKVPEWGKRLGQEMQIASVSYSYACKNPWYSCISSGYVQSGTPWTKWREGTWNAIQLDGWEQEWRNREKKTKPKHQQQLLLNIL